MRAPDQAKRTVEALQKKNMKSDSVVLKAHLALVDKARPSERERERERERETETISKLNRETRHTETIGKLSKETRRRERERERERETDRHTYRFAQIMS
jgi:hypothetical protein